MTFGDKYEYVLRRPPLGPVAKSAHDMSREFKVLSVLYKTFNQSPQAYLFCDDESIIGAPFFIMERKKGIVIRHMFPEEYKKDPDIGKKISIAMVETLAKLHTVKYKEIGLEDLGKPEGFIERQVHGWYRRWNNAKHKDFPEMDEIHKWLADNLPQTSTHSIIHNDFKLDNIMLDKEDPSKIVSVFDWDMCTLGDPFSDVGALLAYWYDARNDPPYMKHIATMPIDPDLNFLTREELVKIYQKHTGFSTSNINFYHVLGLFRLVVIIAQIYIRYVKGQTKDDRFKGFSELIPLLIKRTTDIMSSSN